MDRSAPVAITRHGETLGFYLPAPRKRTEQEWAEFDRAATRMDELMAEIGMSEEELVEDFKRWRALQKRK